MLPETNDQLTSNAAVLGELLQEHKGQDVSVLDLRGVIDWTDFFIIATASSKTHMDGLERHVKDDCREKGIEIMGSSGFKKSKTIDDEWRLIDLGWAVIHLMNKQARDFYELEKLWRTVS
jgi:ribosome-associated protein